MLTIKNGTISMTKRHAAGRSATFAAILVAALTLLALAGARPASAQTPFGIDTFTTSLSDARAGAHPDLTTVFALAEDPASGIAATPRTVRVDLPPGVVGDPGATPTCPIGKVMSGFGGGEPCPLNAAVGRVKVTAGRPGEGYLEQDTLVYNVEPYRNQPAAFAFNAIVNARLDVTVRSDGDYGITATVNEVSENAAVVRVEMTLWGVPADHNGPGPLTDMNTGRSYGGPGIGVRRPLLTNATACTGAEQPTKLSVTPWQASVSPVSASSSLVPLSGCENLPFEPTVRVRPDTTAPGAPAGYDIDIDVPQNADPDGLASAHLKNAKVVLPEGVALSPSVAHGLQACTSAQVGLRSLAAPACPDASRIGSLSITTPLLPDPLEGDVYIGEPLPGNRYRLFLAVEGHGVRVKLEGRVTPDPQTGQLTTTFLDNPQLPFTNLHMELKGGPRAPLANPTTCGVKVATAELEAWSGKTAAPTDAFAIEGCGPRPFAPTWSVGTTMPVAGASSPFTMQITRGDQDQEIDNIAVDLPPGLMGHISRVPLCPSAAAAAGTCGPESQIGTTTVGAGPGPNPFYLNGRVYLTEGYKGAPFGLAFVVPAIAGPYDLGVVNVRAGINVDRTTAELRVASDPLPRILEGIPLRIRDIRIAIDRPGFMVNPTSCAPMAILGRIGSTWGGVASVSSRFQVGECAALPLNPALDMTLSGKGETTDGKHPALKAVLRQPANQANLKSVAVTLPLSLALDPDNAQALCKPEQAAARDCPAASIVGNATAETPVLNKPLSGPVYFVEGLRRTASGQIRRTLPKLWIPLKGEVELDLNADSTVVDEALVATFPTIPDAPVTRFELNIAGGRHGILVVSNSDLCAENQRAEGDYLGHSGKRVVRATRMTVTSCRAKVMRARQEGSSIKLTVGGLGAGTLSMSGADVRKARRTLKGASVANMTAHLTRAGKRKLARSGRLKVRVSFAFTPKGAKRATRLGTTFTLRRP